MNLTIFARFAGGAAAGLLMMAAAATQAEAQTGKVWRHGIIAPKSHAGYLPMGGQAGFTLSPADVVLAAVGGDRDRYTALIGGVVDAAVVSNEYLPLPSSRNFKMLVTGSDAGPNFLRVCMFSTARVLAERRDDAIRY